MLKRLLMVLLWVPLAVTAFAAQLTATLQSGDTFTPFYGSSALVDAYNQAVDGDVITLSPGVFTAPGEIQKSVTLIGAYAFSDDPSKATHISSMTVSADNVTLEGIRFTNTLTIKGADNLSLTRDWLSRVNEAQKEGHKYHNNTILADCLVFLDYAAMALSENSVFRNCCINWFGSINEVSKPALFENCNIPRFQDYSSNSIQPYAIYRNCFLGLWINYASYTLSFSAPSEFHDTVFLMQRLYNSGYTFTLNFGPAVTENVKQESKYGVSYNDIIRVGSFAPYESGGVSYGPANHKWYPAIPAVTESEIDTETDAEGVLHVKITATARD